MVTRKYAKDLIGKHGRDPYGCAVVNIIYDSIGTCGECKYVEILGKRTLHCTNGFNIVKKDWYCADFERKVDESKQEANKHTG